MKMNIPTLELVQKSLSNLYPSLDLVSVFKPISDAQVFVYGGLLRDIVLGKVTKEADLLIVKNQPISEFENEIENTLLSHGFTYLGKVSHLNSANYQYLPPGKTDLKYVIDVNISRHTDYSGDFTMNSLYMDIVSGKLYDLYWGLADMEKGILRTALDPHETFTHSPLCVFRAIKCICQFGFEIDPVTEVALIDSVPLTYQTLAYVADNQQTLLGEWMLDNIFRGLSYDPECYFSYHSKIGTLKVFNSFIKNRLNYRFILSESEPVATSPFLNVQLATYEQKISLFISYLVDQLSTADQEDIFDSIINLFGFRMPNKFHPVGVQVNNLKYIKTL